MKSQNAIFKTIRTGTQIRTQSNTDTPEQEQPFYQRKNVWTRGCPPLKKSIDANQSAGTIPTEMLKEESLVLIHNSPGARHENGRHSDKKGIFEILLRVPKPHPHLNRTALKTLPLRSPLSPMSPYTNLPDLKNSYSIFRFRSRPLLAPAPFFFSKFNTTYYSSITHPPRLFS